MIKFTPQQHKTITDAWKYLENYALERGRMGEVRELNAILADTKKTSSSQSQVEARALLLSVMVDAVDKQGDAQIGDLWQLPRYTREMSCYTWHVLKRHPDNDIAWRSVIIPARHARKARIDALAGSAGLLNSERKEIAS